MFVISAQIYAVRLVNHLAKHLFLMANMRIMKSRIVGVKVSDESQLSDIYQFSVKLEIIPSLHEPNNTLECNQWIAHV